MPNRVDNVELNIKCANPQFAEPVFAIPPGERTSGHTHGPFRLLSLVCSQSQDTIPVRMAMHQG